MIQKISILILLIIIQQGSLITKSESDLSNIIEDQYKAAEIDKIQETVNKLLDKDTKELFPDFTIKDLTNNISSAKNRFGISEVFGRILKVFMGELYLNIKIMLQVIVIVILCGLLTNLQNSFAKGGVSEIAFFTCYIVLIGIMVKSFTNAIILASNAIEDMVFFMQAMIPVLMGLLMSTGSMASAAIFQPVILFFVQLISNTIKSIFIPILSFAIGLTVIDNISSYFHVSKLAIFFKNLSKWALGLMMTVFIGLISIQGLSSSVVDGVGNKTAKFLVGSFIPVIGGVLSDAVDTVLNCSLILKNSVGIAGLIIVVIICLIPIIKILALIIIYRFTTAIIEPVADKRIIKSMSEICDIFTILFSMVLTVALMFFLSITIAVGAGNITAMFR